MRIVAFRACFIEGTMYDLLRLINFMTTGAKIFTCHEPFKPMFALNWDVALDTIAKIHGPVCKSERLHFTMAISCGTCRPQFPYRFALLGKQNVGEHSKCIGKYYCHNNESRHAMKVLFSGAYLRAFTLQFARLLLKDAKRA